MADNKKYYYMRLKENFFDSEEMVLLESMQDGILYSNILIKMYLKSLKSDGRLMFKDTIPYNPQMIATITRHQVGTVEKALNTFADLGLIEVLSDGAIYMNDIELFIGKTSTEGERKRLARMKIEQQKLCIVTNSGQMSDIHPPEIEIEKELELELEKEKPFVPTKVETVYKDSMPEAMVELILNYFSSKMEKKRPFGKTKTTTKLLNTLYKAGYKDISVYQFVIDNKYAQWINNVEMKVRLVPGTLFALSNFEKYVDEDDVTNINFGVNEKNKSWRDFFNEYESNESVDTGNRYNVPKQLGFK